MTFNSNMFNEPVLTRPKNLSFEFIREKRKTEPEQEEPEMKKKTQQRKRQPQQRSQSRSSGERGVERQMEQTGKMITAGAGLLFTGAALGAMFGMLPKR